MNYELKLWMYSPSFYMIYGRTFVNKLFYAVWIMYSYVSYYYSTNFRLRLNIYALILNAKTRATAFYAVKWGQQKKKWHRNSIYLHSHQCSYFYPLQVQTNKKKTQKYVTNIITQLGALFSGRQSNFRYRRLRKKNCKETEEKVVVPYDTKWWSRSPLATASVSPHYHHACPICMMSPYVSLSL